MTLNNCIKRYEIWASDDRISPVIREEHEQIAKWLNSYKKILEQEPVLDNIRAEIIDTGAYEQEVHGKTEFLKGINYCLSVIDKYMAESDKV